MRHRLSTKSTKYLFEVAAGLKISPDDAAEQILGGAVVGMHASLKAIAENPGLDFEESSAVVFDACIQEARKHKCIKDVSILKRLKRKGEIILRDTINQLGDEASADEPVDETRIAIDSEKETS